MARRAVGIDIGTRSIALAELALPKGRATVTNFGGVELDRDVVRDGEILDVDTAAAALEELVGSAKLKTKKVNLGIANQRVVVRQIDLPWLEEKELRAALRYQVQDHIPIPVEEAELDIHLVEDYTTESGDRIQRVLLVAAHRDTVTAHVEAATKAGLKPIGIDLNPFAVLRSMGDDSELEQSNQVLIDVGDAVTNIVVQRGGTPTFVRILVLGSGDITDALATGLSIDHDEAEARKRSLRIGAFGEPGASGDAGAQIVTDHAEQFVDEIRNSLDYYLAQTGSGRLSNVVLTGGGALLDGLARRLATVLRLPVTVGSPFDRWPVTGTVYGPDELALVGPSLAVAVGLGLGGVE